MPAELQIAQADWQPIKQQTSVKQGLRRLPNRGVLLLVAIPMLMAFLAAIPLLDGNPDTFLPFVATETKTPEITLQLDPECSPFAALSLCVYIVDPLAPVTGRLKPSA